MTDLNVDRTRRAIVDHTQRLGESALAAGPETQVPTAPAWTVADLVEHLGQAQHWVADIVERRIVDPMELPTEVPDAPDDPDDWPTWLAESAERVTTAFSDEAMDAPVFNAAGDERTGAQFWISSALNEAVVHGADGAIAAGRPVDVDADIAAALITNHLAMLTSPTWAMQRAESAEAIRGTGQTLQWRAEDVDDAWLVERRADGAVWRPGMHDADVIVSGPASSLLLTLTRRAPLDDREASELRVDGDFALVEHWVENTAHIAD